MAGRVSPYVLEDQCEPWWALIGLTIVTLGLPHLWSKIPGRALIGLLAIGTVLAVYNFGLATYHSGIEWKLWAGPPDCTGTGATLGTDFSLMTSANVIRCDEAAWRMLGLSMAGYNVLASLGAAAICALAGIRLFQIERVMRLLTPGLRTLSLPAKEPQK
jgi:disulfide bond formation protein DsbB